MPKLLTTAELREYLGCSMQNIYNLVASKQLRAYRVGNGRGSLRFSEEQIEEFLKSRESGSARPKPAPPERPVKLKHIRLPPSPPLPLPPPAGANGEAGGGER